MNPKPETRSPKSEIRNPEPKPEIRSPKSKIRNPKSETLTPGIRCKRRNTNLRRRNTIRNLSALTTPRKALPLPAATPDLMVQEVAQKSTPGKSHQHGEFARAAPNAESIHPWRIVLNHRLWASG